MRLLPRSLVVSLVASLVTVSPRPSFLPQVYPVCLGGVFCVRVCQGLWRGCGDRGGMTRQTTRQMTNQITNQMTGVLHGRF